MGARRVAVALLAAWLCSCVALQPEARRFAGWQRLAEDLRELKFSRLFGLATDPVRFEWISQPQIPALVRAEMQRSYPAEYVEAYQAAYKALGFLPPDLDLVETLLALDQDQVVGMYVIARDTMYVRSDLPPGADDLGPIVVHELIHALQARHFGGSIGLLQGLRRNEDLSAAIAAAVEGDASLTMLGVPTEYGSSKRDLATAQHMRKMLLIDLEHPTGAFARAPLLLQHSLLFPYAQGVILAARHYEAAGNAGLDRMLSDPPLSTARVYDPDDTEPVEFIALPRPGLERALAGRGCEPGHDNVAGVMALRALLEEHHPDLDPRRVRLVLRGWSGDRFVHIACGKRPEFLWLTRWRSVVAAERFRSIYSEIAPQIAELVGYADPPLASRIGRQVVVSSAGVRDLVSLLSDASEVRSYASFAEWVADDCFPESPCPGPKEPLQIRYRSQRARP